MSKLAKKITGKWTGNVIAMPFTQVIEESREIHRDFAYEYNVGVKFGASGVVDYAGADNRKMEISEHALSAVRRAVIEEVFGEFRPLIIDLRMSLYDRNYNKSREIISKLEEQMFYEGL